MNIKKNKESVKPAYQTIIKKISASLKYPVDYKNDGLEKYDGNDPVSIKFTHYELRSIAEMCMKATPTEPIVKPIKERIFIDSAVWKKNGNEMFCPSCKHKVNSVRNNCTNCGQTLLFTEKVLDAIS